MFESLESKAIFTWLLSLVTIGLVLWYALGFSHRQAAGTTLEEALARRAPSYIRLGVIATLAAAASYYFSASNALVTLFIALPEALLVPAGILYDLTFTVVCIDIVCAIEVAMSYRRLMKDRKSRRTLHLVTAGYAVAIFVCLVMFTLLGGVGFQASDDSLRSQFFQILYSNPGFFLLLAVGHIANDAYNHQQTLLANQTVQNSIKKIHVLVIAYITVSLIALQVLSVTGALIVLAFLSFEEWDKMRWLKKKVAKLAEPEGSGDPITSE